MRQPPLLAAALVLVPWLAAAKPPPLTVATKLSLAARHVPPTFYAAEPLVVVDRGRVVYLGRGAVRDPEAIELLDLGAATLKTRGKLATKTIAPSIMHVAGSLILPDRLLLRAFDAFYVVDVGG